MGSEESSGRINQYGRMVPVSADGTHVRPEPQPLGFNKAPLTIDSTADGDLLPQVFDIRTQLLSEGRSDYALAVSDRLTFIIKCYASGGENYLHAHTEEDHAFLVLAGAAEFRTDKGTVGILHANQGLLMPHGVYYAFTSVGDEPLVLLRTGVPRPGGKILNLEGVDRHLDNRDITFPEPVTIPGAYYPS